MNLTEITDCMKAYNDIISNSTDLVNLYGQGTYFFYAKPDLSGSEDVHAYPGITKEKKLVFFMIPSEYDVEGTEHLAAHVETCHMHKLLTGGNILPDVVAQEMCERWIDNYASWIPNQVTSSPFGMFRAFRIPADDFQVTTTRVNLALKLDPVATGNMQADVVITNDDGTDVYNYDFADPVPPYPSSLTNSYYLLSLT